MDALLALQPVIHCAGQGYHLLLGRLHTQGHPTLRRGAGGVSDHRISQPAQVRISNQPLVPLVDAPARSVGKEAFQVYQPNSALPAPPAKVPVQLVLDAPEMPVQALVPLAGPVVIDHAGIIERHQDLVAERLMYLPVRDVGRVDGPHLAPLTQGKMGAFPGLPAALQHLPPASGGAGKQVQFKILR